MGYLISRAETLEKLNELIIRVPLMESELGFNGAIMCAKNTIAQLPSAESNASQRIGSVDLISRQMAIDAAIEAADEWDGGYNEERERIIRDALERLPSEEPPNDDFLEFLFQVINPNKMETYLAMYHSKGRNDARE